MIVRDRDPLEDDPSEYDQGQGLQDEAEDAQGFSGASW
jgi:hypothetical protein